MQNIQNFIFLINQIKPLNSNKAQGCWQVKLLGELKKCGEIADKITFYSFN